MNKKNIILTGGGSAGHVTPNLALSKKLQLAGWDISYIGSAHGIEKELITKARIPYYAIATGKLRRYFSWRNFLDPWKILYGIFQSYFYCKKIKPNIIFSKGGFVAFPVVVAAWLQRIPVITHESDLTVGLANKLCFPFAKKICISFPETAKTIKDQSKVVVTGIPIREEFFQGDAEVGRKFCDFTSAKRVILVFGGSLGADAINRAVRKLLPEILTRFQIVHVCGENKIALNYDYPEYKQYTYLHDEFPNILAAADLVIARAGANTIYELLAVRKPNILIPLGKTSSRGDQIINAAYCVEHGYSAVISPEEFTAEILLQKINWIEENRETIVKAIEQFVVPSSVQMIYELINTYGK